MYMCTVERTQIYLTRDEHAALERAAVATGKTKSQRWAADDLRSVNGQVEFLLRRALADAGRLPPRATGDQREGSRTDRTPGEG